MKICEKNKSTYILLYLYKDRINIYNIYLKNYKLSLFKEKIIDLQLIK